MAGPGRNPHIPPMFAIEHLQRRAVILQDRSEAERLEDAIHRACLRAAVYGADEVRIFDAEGQEIGVYPVEGQQDA
jgi:hypothetical protein